MIARLIDTAPIWGSTIAPAVLLLGLGILLQPNSVHPPRHREGVRATRIVRRLEAERGRYRRPTGFQSPLFTVPREATR
ncbi:hypothetical protein ABGB07_02115 [Micromonosporaceae bacterium B7E4]